MKNIESLRRLLPPTSPSDTQRTLSGGEVCRRQLKLLCGEMLKARGHVKTSARSVAQGHFSRADAACHDAPSRDLLREGRSL